MKKIIIILFFLLLLLAVVPVSFAAPTQGGSERYHEDAPVTFQKSDDKSEPGAETSGDASQPKTGSSGSKPTKVEPTTIRCVPNLPCITEETQKTSGGVEKHVIEKFGVAFLTIFLGIVGITAVIFLIVGGLQMHLAFGNQEALTKAKKTIGWAIVGLVTAILSVALVRIISTLFEK